MSIYRALAALLTYPEAPLIAALPELRDEIRRAPGLGLRHKEALDRLVAEMAAFDLIDAQERYGALFDRVRSVSLHLFEHVHGASRDRGMAMVDLMALYRRHGLEIAANELPDYVPMFLEFLSTIDPAEAARLLGDTAHIVDRIHGRLAERGSAYAAVFAALLRLAGAAPSAPPAAAADEDSFEALDRAWEEAAVKFGPDDPSAAQNGSACSRADAVVARLAAR
jgi:nitrate reductase delta subunit